MDILELAGYAPLKQLMESAQAGDVNAQYNLGVLYFEGKDAPQDYMEAAKWYGAAADQGDKQAQFNLGLMFYRGIGLPQNYEYAYQLFEQAANQGDERARLGMSAILTEAPPDIAAKIKSISHNQLN
ncbi:hypothetical protein CAP31_05480 [Sulfuriferula sp. AH1]|uniref:tetratricopeptide repeat protein n=1 Tax=Sulfuriferula sp. AH1 TaxID=1985873 RepID=UPI000B3B2617|nr:tetratricopeptide repeat protein [Sulfuriferula sp. AH1]ARU31185.1 hypothetical protein CAP31_05480 [Sulfuriferula sp. AH1]